MKAFVRVKKGHKYMTRKDIHNFVKGYIIVDLHKKIGLVTEYLGIKSSDIAKLAGMNSRTYENSVYRGESFKGYTFITEYLDKVIKEM